MSAELQAFGTDHQEETQYPAGFLDVNCTQLAPKIICVGGRSRRFREGGSPLTLHVNEWSGRTLLELQHMDVARIISEQPN
jgi:hypothetical protein